MGVAQVGRNNAVSSSSAWMRFRIPSCSVSLPQREYCARTPHRMTAKRSRLAERVVSRRSQAETLILTLLL